MEPDLELPATAWVVLGLVSVRPAAGHELAGFSERSIGNFTEAGTSQLRRWLEHAPVQADRQRNLFLVRVFFGDQVSPERLDAVLDDYAANARAYRATLAAVLESLADRPGSAYRRATALFGMRHAQATLDWVADVRLILHDSSACRVE